MSNRARSIVLWFGVIALLAVAGTIYFKHAHGPAVSVPPDQPPPVLSEDPDARNRRLVVGTWEDDYEGKRTMTLKEDGTGTMVVELTGIKAAPSASRLRFDMTWTLSGGRLQKQTVGGEPAGTVQLILKTMGDRVDEPILELTEDRLRLLDKDGKTKYDWRRKATAPPPQ